MKLIALIIYVMYMTVTNSKQCYCHIALMALDMYGELVALVTMSQEYFLQ